MSYQDAERVRQRRSRLIEILNVAIEILGCRKCWRGFSVRQDPLYGRTAPRMRSVPPPVSTRLRPCSWKRRVSARQGWAGEKAAFLSILCEFSCCP
jgi:hypothetical protein